MYDYLVSIQDTLIKDIKALLILSVIPLIIIFVIWYVDTVLLERYSKICSILFVGMCILVLSLLVALTVLTEFFEATNG